MGGFDRRAVAGGQIAPKDVVGRDTLIRNLWRLLERQSVVLSAERRLGKTSIIRKMVAEPVPGVLPLFRDLEGIRTPFEFAEAVLRDVEEYLSKGKKIANRAREVLKHIGGAEVATVKINLQGQGGEQSWKLLLESAIADLAEHQDDRVIFFWDEMPLMLYNIKEDVGEDAAMQLLDTLRSLRQTYSNIRMVYTGSIGLHNVITALKRAKYANDPTNDMRTVDVPPLSHEYARELARRLMEGEEIACMDTEETITAIAEHSDGVAFYIHHIVDYATQLEEPLNAEKVRLIIDQCLRDPQDCWHLGYYQERIGVYYTSQEKLIALTILDILAVSDTPLSFNETFEALKAHVSVEDRNEDTELARSVLLILQRDHYIVLNDEGHYAFRFPLIRRAWRLQRGLS